MTLNSFSQMVIENRGVFEKKQTRLLVDYYRIRRKISFPLPLDKFYIPKFPCREFTNYPWSIWMIWRLEERFHALYNAYHFAEDKPCGELLIQELEHFASWPSYNQLKGKQDLSTGHCGRLLYKAIKEWEGLPEDLILKLKKACSQLVEENYPLVLEYYEGVTDVESILNDNKPHSFMHNIGFIGALGVAFCAYCIEDDRYRKILEILRTVTLALIRFSREKGYSEGLAYDGYMFDFYLDIMHLYSPEEQSELLNNDIMRGIMEQVIHSSVSGNSSERAELGDVESREMTFDISALIKYQKFYPVDSFSWYIHQAKERSLRNDSLSHLIQMDYSDLTPPSATVSKLRATVALRSGWAPQDISVVVSASNSVAGHIDKDAGSVVIGTQGHWLIGDPGYQQYLETDERNYTIGPKAHNYPCINQLTQTKKAMKILSLQNVSEKSVTLDLTACYADEKTHKVLRKIWVLDQKRIVIRDNIEASVLQTVDYTWHGNNQGYCYINGWGLSQIEDAVLWFKAVEYPFLPDALDRLKGSRGALSFSLNIDKPKQVIWWVFTTNESAIDSAYVRSDNYLIWGDNRLSATE